MVKIDVRIIVVAALVAGAVIGAETQVIKRKAAIVLPDAATVRTPPPPVASPTTYPRDRPPVIWQRPEFAGEDAEGKKWEYCNVIAPIDGLGDPLQSVYPKDLNQPNASPGDGVMKAFYFARMDRYVPAKGSFMGEMNSLGAAGWETVSTVTFQPTTTYSMTGKTELYVCVLMKRRVKPE